MVMLVRLLGLTFLLCCTSVFADSGPANAVENTMESAVEGTVENAAPENTASETADVIERNNARKPSDGKVVPQPAVGSGITTTSPLTVLLGLGFVVALIMASAWLMKRLGAGHVGGGGNMKIVAGLAVGPREKVLLIEVGGRQSLIGVAPGRVSFLQDFDEPVITRQVSESSDFSAKLQSLLQRAPKGGGQ